MNKPRTTRWILLVLAVAGLGYFGWQRFHVESHEAVANNAQKAPRNAVRVGVAAVEKIDFPVYLTSLGTVRSGNGPEIAARARVERWVQVKESRARRSCSLGQGQALLGETVRRARRVASDKSGRYRPPVH